MQSCTLTMTVAREFVLSRREDSEKPVDKGIAWIKQRLGEKVTIDSATLTEFVATLRVNDRVDLPFFVRSTAHDLEIAMRKLYGLPAGSPEFVVWDSFVAPAMSAPPSAAPTKPAVAREVKRPDSKRTESEPKRAEPEPESEQEQPRDAPRPAVQGDEMASSPKTGEAPGQEAAPTMSVIDKLLGAQAFKMLAKELQQLAPIMREHGTLGAFHFQNYLFSIGDGCGLTTSLHMFADLVGELGLFAFNGDKKVLEMRLAASDSGKGTSELEETAGLLAGRGGGGKLVCLDISEWMTRLKDDAFRKFLVRLEALEEKYLFVFRVPFLDKDTLEDISQALGDVLFIRPVVFPPLNGQELAEAARRVADYLGFALEADAWDLFNRRMAQEKSDGRFYGMNTVRKVIREMIYRTYQTRLGTGEMALGPMIRSVYASDLAGFTRDQETGGEDARTQLGRLIGLDTVKQRIDEMLAQIAYARQHPEMGVPCLHMRFVGNPGTGKTTVARLLGRMLAERGILRNGLFFEHAGRDFCGRYIGETAPKTAAICRDAYGSVLFVDEAYSLYRGEEDTRDYGREALDTLIAEMENHRSDLVVIMAGYPDDMDTLMKGNAGLAGRMPFLIEFPNYGREDLKRIFRLMAGARAVMEEGFLTQVDAWFDALPDALLNSRAFSNARFVRNLFERVWGKAAMRAQLAGVPALRLTVGDFLEATGDREFTVLNKPRRERIGFLG